MTEDGQDGGGGEASLCRSWHSSQFNNARPWAVFRQQTRTHLRPCVSEHIQAGYSILDSFAKPSQSISPGEHAVGGDSEKSVCSRAWLRAQSVGMAAALERWRNTMATQAICRNSKRRIREASVKAAAVLERLTKTEAVKFVWTMTRRALSFVLSMLIRTLGLLKADCLP